MWLVRRQLPERRRREQGKVVGVGKALALSLIKYICKHTHAKTQAEIRIDT